MMIQQCKLKELIPGSRIYHPHWYRHHNTNTFNLFFFISFSGLIETLKADIALKDSMLQGISEENSRLRNHSRTIRQSVRSQNVSKSFNAAQRKRVTPYSERSLSQDGTISDEDLVLGRPASAGVVVEAKPGGQGIQFQLATTRSNVPAKKDVSNTEIPTKVHDSSSEATVLPPLNQSQTVSFKLTTTENNRIKGPFLKRPVQVNATKITSSGSPVIVPKSKNIESGNSGKLLQARSFPPGSKQWRTHRTFGQQKNVSRVDNKKLTL